MASMEATGEKYNVELHILEIIRHPDFDPTKGPIGGNDLAVFKVSDTKLRNNGASDLDLWPACLHTDGGNKQRFGIHTGWSDPPPYSFIEREAKGFVSVYDNFYKQWHYKMEIFDICEDPIKAAVNDDLLLFPSNSSYPAGTVCAKDWTRQSCFSSGDSGSPLMIKDSSGSQRYYIEGVLSFIRGCTIFEFGRKKQF